MNLDGKAPPLADGLGEMAADLAAFRLAEMKLVIAREWDCPFNWKVLVENFMESYHHLGIHHKTLQPMMPARDTWTEQERRHYVRAHLPYKDSVREAYRAFERARRFFRGAAAAARVRAMRKNPNGDCFSFIRPFCSRPRRTASSGIVSSRSARTG